MDYFKLQESNWNTTFKVISKSKKRLIIEVNQLAINGKLILDNPQREWFMYWDDNVKFEM